MKSIQVTNGTHHRVMELKKYPINSANEVIEKLLAVHHSEQWKNGLRVFCLEYEYTHPQDTTVSVKVMHSLGKDSDDAESNLSMSNFDNGKHVLIKSYPIDILYCGGVFAVTPIEQIS